MCLLCSKFQGLLNKCQKFLCMSSRTRENDKNKVETVLWDTRYYIIMSVRKPLFRLSHCFPSPLTEAIMRQVLAGFDRGAERTADFTFGHTGHMDIILGRGGGRGQDTARGTGGLLENIKEKAKNVTKRNFL